MKAKFLIVTAFCCSIVWSQTEPLVTHTFQFAHLQDQANLAEAATVIRSTGQVRELRVDAGTRTMTVRGSTAQIELTEWLWAKLDRTPVEQRGGADAYQMPETPDGKVRIFWSAAGSPQTLQELSIALRTITEIPALFTFNPLSAIVMRGTADQVAMAEWLFDQVEQKRTASAAWRVPGGSDDFGRVFYLTSAVTPEQQQQINAIRTTTRVKRMFTSPGLRVLAMRGTAEQVAEVERLLRERGLSVV